MTGWGSVLSIEAQERIYYALAGNHRDQQLLQRPCGARRGVAESGTMKIPNPNYLVPSSFGSLELRQRNGNEFIGQTIDYSRSTVNVRTISAR